MRYINWNFTYLLTLQWHLGQNWL